MEPQHKLAAQSLKALHHEPLVALPVVALPVVALAARVVLD